MTFTSYFHDPDGLFINLLENLNLPKELKGSYVSVTPETIAKSYDLISSFGFKIIRGGPYGYSKLTSLRESVKNLDFEHIMVCDFDKLIHWLTVDREEFLSMMKKPITGDFINIARSKKSKKTYPDSWLETENITAKILEKVTGLSIDVMNGPVILSRKAAELISSLAQETEVGACTEWALLCHLNNLSIINLEVDGLTWEDPDRYPEAIKLAPSFEHWKDTTFDSLYEWRKRVEFLHMQLKAMIRLTHEPSNPKFPYVHNQKFTNE